MTLYSDLPVPFEAGSFDAALLFHVLCSVPESEAQEALVSELVRVLRPGGVFYLSDYPLQSDEKHLARYRRFAPLLGVYGMFRISDGGTFRHHTEAWFQHLLAPFEEVWSQYFPMKTMHGRPVTGFQFLGRKR